MRKAILTPTAGDYRPATEVARHCLVVVPTYNEAPNISRLIDAVLALGPRFDLLVVDDNSPDGTGELVAAAAQRTPRVQLMGRAGKQGLGSAYISGFQRGLEQGYRFLCEMDADFSHQPHDLPALLAAVERDADLVIGSRYVAGGRVENWPLMRRMLSRGGSAYARQLLRLPIRDLTGGFKCFRAEALRQIDMESIRSTGYAFQIELTYRCYQAGMVIREIPIVFRDRVAGRSKMSRQIMAEAALMVLRMSLARPGVDALTSRALPARTTLLEDHHHENISSHH